MKKVTLGDSWIEKGNLQDFDMEIDFDLIWNMKPNERGEVIIYGKKIEVPRYQKSYGRDYTFTGINHKSLPIGDLQFILDFANSISKGYNQILINWYENGLDYIGPHSDDERELIPNSSIFSISLGESRKFRIREKYTKKIIEDTVLNNGNIIIMGGNFQKSFTHEIVKVSGKKGMSVGRRINITLRKFKLL